MTRDLKPLNVSPVIKTVRWSLLFLGYMYGAHKYHSLTIYEEKARVIRHNIYKEKQRKEREIDTKHVNVDMRSLYEAVGETDIPPEYRD